MMPVKSFLRLYCFLFVSFGFSPEAKRELGQEHQARLEGEAHGVEAEKKKKRTKQETKGTSSVEQEGGFTQKVLDLFWKTDEGDSNTVGVGEVFKKKDTETIRGPTVAEVEEVIKEIVDQLKVFKDNADDGNPPECDRMGTSTTYTACQKALQVAAKAEQKFFEMTGWRQHLEGVYLQYRPLQKKIVTMTSKWATGKTDECSQCIDFGGYYWVDETMARKFVADLAKKAEKERNEGLANQVEPITGETPAKVKELEEAKKKLQEARDAWSAILRHEDDGMDEEEELDEDGNSAYDRAVMKWKRATGESGYYGKNPSKKVIAGMEKKVKELLEAEIAKAEKVKELEEAKKKLQEAGKAWRAMLRHEDDYEEEYDDEGKSAYDRALMKWKSATGEDGYYGKKHYARVIAGMEKKVKELVAEIANAEKVKKEPTKKASPSSKVLYEPDLSSMTDKEFDAIWDMDSA